MTDKFQLIPFPIKNAPPETLDLLGAIADVLRTTERLSRTASQANLDEDRKLALH